MKTIKIKKTRQEEPGRDKKLLKAVEGPVNRISSDDENSRRDLEDEEKLDDSDVSDAERKALEEAAEKTPGVIDDQNLEESRLEHRDEEGELLNEVSDRSGRDLDIPGSEDDDDSEDIGVEDEENNPYSLGGEEEDDSVNRQ